MMEKAYERIFLDNAISEKVQVTVFLLGGFQIKGIILAHDERVVVLDVSGRQQVVYKNGVSTIIPSKNLDIFGG